MNTQFHTPSLGDEEFDLTDIDSEPMIEVSNANRFNTTPIQQAPSTNSVVDVPEAVKPVSAYALFFRDTVSAIKVQNPNTSFDEISKIVSSMWQVLDPAHKNVYNKKSDLAKKEYIQKMAAYRNSQMRQTVQDELTINNSNQHDSTFNHHSNISPKPVASKPVVFTISPRPATTNDSQNSTWNDQQTQQTQQNPMQNNIVSSNNTNSQQIENVAATGNQQPTNQLISDAGSTQICLRENCNKRGVINPDWEDEYCSNECVVIHCRNVFNQWVKSNAGEKM